MKTTGTLICTCLLFLATAGCGSPSTDGAVQASAAGVPEVDFQKQFEEAQRRAEEERLQQQELQQKRRGLVEVAFHGFDDQERVVVSLINRTGKPIDDLRGGIIAEDAEGNYLASSGFTIAVPGEVFLDVDATVNHAPFVLRKPELIERLESRPDAVRFAFEAQEITYIDGTREPGLDS